ncbi:hypothetical protein BV25DRAFT_442734 [Artomyces pyxidatus]|uniref:Uncharacterized protein n=1 Tax=Artomyces pyxidatus TaxID=48021 RepID=A0ACB8T2M5_9AGAM|nr:hypothetical protein BV25DRAFT_442734 [Artomyces pyxidatus]
MRVGEREMERGTSPGFCWDLPKRLDNLRHFQSLPRIDAVSASSPMSWQSRPPPPASVPSPCIVHHWHPPRPVITVDRSLPTPSQQEAAAQKLSSSRDAADVPAIVSPLLPTAASNTTFSNSFQLSPNRLPVIGSAYDLLAGYWTSITPDISNTSAFCPSSSSSSLCRLRVLSHKRRFQRPVWQLPGHSRAPASS